MNLGNKTREYTFIVMTIIALAASAAWAHGDKKHIVGTVEKVNSESVVVKTAAGKSVEVKLVATTIYVLRTGTEDKPAKQGDLAVGARVVVHATPRGEALEAAEVRFSAPAPATVTSKPRS
jgi:hypothetical protein